MEIPSEKAIKVLRDSVAHGLEEGVKGSRYAPFHNYFKRKSENENLTPEEVKQLGRAVQSVAAQFGNLEIGLFKKGEFLSVDSIAMGDGSKMDVREGLKIFLDYHVKRCMDAIVCNSGFGKYANLSFCRASLVVGRGIENYNALPCSSSGHDFTF